MRKQRGWIGIDIGAHSIKMAQVQKLEGRLQLIDAAVVERKDPWEISSQRDTRPHSTTSELAAALKIGDRFRGRQVASTLTMSLCDIRSLRTTHSDPEMKRRVVRDHLATIERFQSEERQFDFWSIPHEWQSRSAENTYVLSMQQQWAHQVALDHRATRLECSFLEGLPMSLARASKWVPPSFLGIEEDQPLALLDLGYSRCTFCIQSAGRPIYVRMFRRSGLRQAIKLLAERLSISAQDAQLILSEWGLPEVGANSAPLQAAIYSAVSPWLRQVLAEFHRTLDYLRFERVAELPENLLLFGGGATIANVDAWIQEKMNLATCRFHFPAPRENFRWPMELFGPAIASSMLAWSADGSERPDQQSVGGRSLSCPTY